MAPGSRFDVGTALAWLLDSWTSATSYRSWRFLMNKRVARMLVLALCVVGGSVRAADVPDVTSLAWMAGSWQGTAGGVEMEEHWLAPRGGEMLGLNRDVAGGRMVSFEFLRIEKD